ELVAGVGKRPVDPGRAEVRGLPGVDGAQRRPVEARLFEGEPKRRLRSVRLVDPDDDRVHPLPSSNRSIPWWQQRSIAATGRRLVACGRVELAAPACTRRRSHRLGKKRSASNTNRAAVMPAGTTVLEEKRGPGEVVSLSDRRRRNDRRRCVQGYSRA